jgi:hypothetical protein
VDDNSVITLLASITDPPEPASRVSIAAALRRGRRQRRLQVGAVALAVVAVAVAVVAVPRITVSGDTGRSSGPGSIPFPSGWSRLPDAPIAARSEYAAVWTGREMIVWGGYSWDGSFPVTAHFYGDGAAYDPTTRMWKTIAASPLAPREDSVTVWTGKEMLVFGGVGPNDAPGGAGYSDGAAYDPWTNSWRKLAPTPPSLGQLTDTGSYAVWTGKVMLVWGFSPNGDGSGSLAAATYNPATNRWETGAIAPAAAPPFGDAFWTGKEMLVWGTSAGHPEGLSYDPATRRWASLPASPLGDVSRSDMLAVWTGTFMVVGGGLASNLNNKDEDGRTKAELKPAKPTLQKDAALYDPVTNSWTRLPDAPAGFEGSARATRGWDIWTGASVITIEDGVAGGRPLSLDLATNKWSLGPNAPVPGRQEAHELWNGQEVLVWGGGVPVGNWCCKTVAQGYGYRP